MHVSYFKQTRIVYKFEECKWGEKFFPTKLITTRNQGERETPTESDYLSKIRTHWI